MTKKWQANKQWASDRDSWIWGDSRFHLTTRNKPIRRRMIQGVELSMVDLQKILPSAFGEHLRKRRGGPAPDITKRSLVWKILLEMAVKRELYESWLDKSQEDLVGHVMDLMVDRNETAGKTITTEVVQEARATLSRLRAQSIA